MSGNRADCRAPVKAATAKGHTHKHARAHKAKHHHTTKHHPHHVVHHATKHGHHVHAKAKHATHAKARGLALVPGDVACCTAEALGASLRLQGLSVAGGDLLGLFRLAGGDEDAGAPIVAMLEAASAFGLGGVRPAWAACPVVPGILFPPDLERAIGMDGAVAVVGGAEQDPVVGAAAREHALDRDAGLAGVPAGAPLGDCLPGHDCPPVRFGPGLPWSDSNRRGPDASSPCTGADATPGRTRFGLFGYAGKPGVTSLLLGLDLPGPHAVLATPEGWWSWGELWCPCEFPDAVIEEAWAVTWAVAA